MIIIETALFIYNCKSFNSSISVCHLFNKSPYVSERLQFSLTLHTVPTFLPAHSIRARLLLTRLEVAGFLMPHVSSCNLTCRVWHVTVACLILCLSWCLLVPSPDHRLQSGRCHGEHKRAIQKRHRGRRQMSRGEAAIF